MDHCHYTGVLRGEKDSLVAISTCNGLSGMIYDGSNFHYFDKITLNYTEGQQICHRSHDNGRPSLKRVSFFRFLIILYFIIILYFSREKEI